MLGVDRDSAIVAHLFDERDPAVKAMIASVITRPRPRAQDRPLWPGAERLPRICPLPRGAGIESISLNPDAVLKTLVAIAAIEQPGASRALTGLSSYPHHNRGATVYGMSYWY